MLKIIVYLLLGLVSFQLSHAHLLNMTEVTVSIDDSQGVEVSLRIDLTRELGSNEAYFKFSQKSEAALFRDYADLLKQLTNAVELNVDGVRLPLGLTVVQAPSEATFEDFESPFEWPRTVVTLSASLDSPSTTMQITFVKGFAFEEPIAVSMRDEVSGLSKSRWLVAGQSSPVFTYAEVGAGAVVALASTPSAETSRFADLPSYLKFGFEHILPMGVDHLVFVLGIFLAARTGRHLVAQISVFTLAHTVTLGLASYKIIEPPGQIVEVLIAISILWIGVENIWIRRQGKGRYLVIAGFGLLHGMGFAGALSGLNLPRDNFVVALLGFNVGVELGQLSFIAILFAIFGWFRGKVYYVRFVVVPLSLAICVVAVYWIVERV